MGRGIVLGALVAVGALSVGLTGQQQRATLPDLQKVKDNLYIIGASSPVDRTQFTGGNVSVLVTDGGVVVVDTKLAGYGPDILAKIRAVTSKPVTTIINTHTHGDHTGSNEGFPASVNIVAHENTKTLMAKMDAFKGDKAQFLPKQTFKDRLTLGSPRLCRFLIELCQREGIPCQRNMGGGTDASAMQRTKLGALCTTIGAPTRYMHSTVQLAHLDDVRATSALLRAFAEHAHELYASA